MQDDKKQVMMQWIGCPYYYPLKLVLAMNFPDYGRAFHVPSLASTHNAQFSLIIAAFRAHDNTISYQCAIAFVS
jgi:hypothetical protein